MTTSAIGSSAVYHRRAVNAYRLINSRLELLRRLLCSCGYASLDVTYHRQAGEATIRQYAPTLDAKAVLDIIDPPLTHWGWRVVDVWACYDAPRPYERFVQIRLSAPPLDTSTY